MLSGVRRSYNLSKFADITRNLMKMSKTSSAVLDQETNNSCALVSYNLKSEDYCQGREGFGEDPSKGALVALGGRDCTEIVYTGFPSYGQAGNHPYHQMLSPFNPCTTAHLFPVSPCTRIYTPATYSCIPVIYQGFTSASTVPVFAQPSSPYIGNLSNPYMHLVVEPQVFNQAKEEKVNEQEREKEIEYKPTNQQYRNRGYAGARMGGRTDGQEKQLKHQVCRYYVRTGGCKFGAMCRYHHGGEPSHLTKCDLSEMGLPLRPCRPICTFYSQNGICKYGPTCRFHHPLDVALRLCQYNTTSDESVMMMSLDRTRSINNSSQSSEEPSSSSS